MNQFLSTLPKMSVLLLFLPVAAFLQAAGNEGLPLFVVAGLGILGTVTLIGKATEEIAIYAGPLWGGLLNATFGNVTELIIALFALAKGPAMFPIVLGSIVGSILGNLLLVLGAAMVYGGIKYQVQKFSRTGAQVNIGMLWVVLSALVVPSLVHLAYHINPEAFPDLTLQQAHDMVQHASLTAAIILLLLYVLSLIFSLRTHRFLFMPGKGEHEEQADWSLRLAAGVLLAATLAVAYLSEAFVGAIEHLKDAGTLAMSNMFIGVIVVAVVGNAAEGMVAVWVAREDKMELSFQIAMGSCLQVALLVTPILVIASYWITEPMPLTFDPFLLMALAAATAIASASLVDGESNWLEGAMLLAVYLFFALVFWFHP
ncbi:MAG: calcium/proton exchanger [Gemmatales bacterium]|nr:MAG: calcium/proton exchanger [Gemmatales bacterium]